MKKYLVISTLLLTAGLAYAAGGTSRANATISRATVLNPFTLQVMAATRSPVTSTDGVRPILPLNPEDTGGVRPGPFTPPPRSPYVPPPR